ncbi:hypothetical protein VDGD_20399 [Verticillium dahliae]|nr:hypothetical protein VDGD_20399 [Verticillium dahliae]
MERTTQSSASCLSTFVPACEDEPSVEARRLLRRRPRLLLPLRRLEANRLDDRHLLHQAADGIWHLLELIKQLLELEDAAAETTGDLKMSNAAGDNTKDLCHCGNGK